MCTSSGKGNQYLATEHRGIATGFPSILNMHSQKDWLVPLFIIISDNFLFIFSQVH